MRETEKTNLFGRFNRWLSGSEAPDEYYEENEENYYDDHGGEREYDYRRSGDRGKAIPFERDNRGNGEKTEAVKRRGELKVAIYKLARISDVEAVIDEAAFNPVIVELIGEEKQRMLDFMSGAMYALNGSLTRVAGDVFAIAPERCSVIEAMEK